jgi:hypothetical protein
VSVGLFFETVAIRVDIHTVTEVEREDPFEARQCRCSTAKCTLAMIWEVLFNWVFVILYG